MNLDLQELLSIFTIIFKIAGLLAICLFIWFLYVFAVNPYLIRRKYAKYPNVVQSKDFQFMKGDLYEVKENEAKKQFRYWHHIEMASSDNQPDLYLRFVGPTPFVMLFSPQALREFSKLVPHKIDRNDYFLDRYLGKIFYNSFTTDKSHERWKLRRDTSMRTLGINFASRYVQLLVENLETCLKKIEIGKEINFSLEFAQIDYEFTSKLLFGRDFDQREKNIPYRNSDGSIKMVDLGELIYLNMDDTLFFFNFNIEI